MNFGDRRDSHFSLLRNGKHACAEMQNDFLLHGEDNFEFVVLTECGEDCIDEQEAHYISCYMGVGLAYNKCSGGRTGYSGVPLSESAKKIIGEKNRVNMLGRRASDETRKKMSEAHLGRKLAPLSEETKRHLSEANSGEHAPLAKLTEQQVLEIRRLRKEESLTYTAIAKMFGVTYQCVSDICNYKRWKYTA